MNFYFYYLDIDIPISSISTGKGIIEQPLSCMLDDLTCMKNFTFSHEITGSCQSYDAFMCIEKIKSITFEFEKHTQQYAKTRKRTNKYFVFFCFICDRYTNFYK